MDIRQLQYFVEIVKRESFTAASSSLHVAQPTLSKTVKQLEEELHTTLLDRTKRKTTVTSTGKILYDKALEMLVLCEEIKEAIDDEEHLRNGHLHIGMPPLIGILFFPILLKGFQKDYPQIEFQLDEVGANIVKERVFKNELDGGFIMMPANQEDFDIVPFLKKHVFVIVHKEHPLAERDALYITDLRDENLLLFSADFTLHDRIKQEFTKNQIEPHIAFESSQWEFISQMVEHNLGVSLLPEPYAKKANSDKVNMIPLVHPIEWELAFITKKGKYKSSAMNCFLNHLKMHSKMESL